MQSKDIQLDLFTSLTDNLILEEIKTANLLPILSN